jgi:hypothetical protein
MNDHVVFGAKSGCLGTCDCVVSSSLIATEEHEPNASGPCAVAEMGVWVGGGDVGCRAPSTISEGTGEVVENRIEGSIHSC